MNSSRRNKYLSFGEGQGIFLFLAKRGLTDFPLSFKKLPIGIASPTFLEHRRVRASIPVA